MNSGQPFAPEESESDTTVATTPPASPAPPSPVTTITISSTSVSDLSEFDDADASGGSPSPPPPRSPIHPERLPASPQGPPFFVPRSPPHVSPAEAPATQLTVALSVGFQDVCFPIRQMASLSSPCSLLVARFRYRPVCALRSTGRGRTLCSFLPTLL